MGPIFLLDPAQRPAQAAQHNHLLAFRVAQDVGHPGERTAVPLACSTSEPSPYGRFSGVAVWPVLSVHRGPSIDT